ncbi:hypothetical protein FGIG_00025 [Fasciola gigantica]|uniref:Uncharacterized protein n=1 Tax=Fasciola gigantica TaxID=46835 RepID=A0A504XP21_FASGI|nr:hypothetical protein FGIG_00025 [Fasciola gigantica]
MLACAMLAQSPGPMNLNPKVEPNNLSENLDSGLTDESHERWDRKFFEEFVYRESTADTISSVCILGKRIVRQYASEFVLPDDTRVAVGRLERTNPADGEEQVTLTLSLGVVLNEQQLAKASIAASHMDGGDVEFGAFNYTNLTSSDEMTSELSNDEYTDREFRQGGRSWYKQNKTEMSNIRPSAPQFRGPMGLRIAEYMDDDPWAASILVADSSANTDLLRQLEAGCRLEPESYRMERVQRRRNLETVIDLHRTPTVRSIGLSRTQSETDSIDTAFTTVDEEEEKEQEEGEMEEQQIDE